MSHQPARAKRKGEATQPAISVAPESIKTGLTSLSTETLVDIIMLVDAVEDVQQLSVTCKALHAVSRDVHTRCRWFLARFGQSFVITESMRTRLCTPALIQAFIGISLQTMPISFRHAVSSLALGTYAADREIVLGQDDTMQRLALVRLWSSSDSRQVSVKLYLLQLALKGLDLAFYKHCHTSFVKFWQIWREIRQLRLYSIQPGSEAHHTKIDELEKFCADTRLRFYDLRDAGLARMQDLFISSPARYLALAKLVGVQFTSAHAISEALAARMTRDALTAGDFGAIKALDPRFNVSEELFRYIVAASNAYATSLLPAFEEIEADGALPFDLGDVARDLVIQIEFAGPSDLLERLAALAFAKPSPAMQLILGKTVLDRIDSFAVHRQAFARYNIAPTPAFLVVLSMEPTESLLPLLTYLEECEFSTEEKEWTAKAILECCLLRDKAGSDLDILLERWQTDLMTYLSDFIASQRIDPSKLQPVVGSAVATGLLEVIERGISPCFHSLPGQQILLPKEAYRLYCAEFDFADLDRLYAARAEDATSEQVVYAREYQDPTLDTLAAHSYQHEEDGCMQILLQHACLANLPAASAHLEYLLGSAAVSLCHFRLMAAAAVTPHPLLIGSIGHRPVRAADETGTASFAAIERSAQVYARIFHLKPIAQSSVAVDLPYASEWREALEEMLTEALATRAASKTKVSVFSNPFYQELLSILKWLSMTPADRKSAMIVPHTLECSPVQQNGYYDSDDY